VRAEAIRGRLNDAMGSIASQQNSGDEAGTIRSRSHAKTDNDRKECDQDGDSTTDAEASDGG